jgi:hypothetical protein
LIIRAKNSFCPQTALIGLYSGDCCILVEVGTEVIHNLDERHFAMILTDAHQLMQIQVMEFQF